MVQFHCGSVAVAVENFMARDTDDLLPADILHSETFSRLKINSTFVEIHWRFMAINPNSHLHLGGEMQRKGGKMRQNSPLCNSACAKACS